MPPVTKSAMMFAALLLKLFLFAVFHPSSRPKPRVVILLMPVPVFSTLNLAPDYQF